MVKSKKEIKKRILLDLEKGHFNHAQKVLLESKDIISTRLYSKLEKEIKLCLKYKDNNKLMRYVYFMAAASILNGFLWISLWSIFYDFMGYNSFINITIKLVLLVVPLFINHLISRFIKFRMGLCNYWNKFDAWGGFQLLLMGVIIFLTIRDFFR